jgi:hypothetical protein
MKTDDIDIVRLPPPTTLGMEITIKNTSDKPIQIIEPEPLYIKLVENEDGTSEIKYFWEETSEEEDETAKKYICIRTLVYPEEVE